MHDLLGGGRRTGVGFIDMAPVLGYEVQRGYELESRPVGEGDGPPEDVRGRHERADVGRGLRLPHLGGLLFVKMAEPVQGLGNAGVAFDESGVGEGPVRVVLHTLPYGVNVEALLLEPMDELVRQGKLVKRPKVRRPLDDEDPLVLGIVPPQHDFTVDIQEQVVQTYVLFNRPYCDQKGLLILDIIPVLFEVLDEKGHRLFRVDDLALDRRIEAETADGGCNQGDGVQSA